MDLNMNTCAVNFEDNITVALAPTEYSCISVVIPKASSAPSFIRRTIYKSVESIGFICAIIVFTVGRIIISKVALKHWFDIFYSTIGALMAQATLTPKTTAERIVYTFLLVTSVFTTVMLSVLIYTSVVNNPTRNTIQTLDDLAASNYDIYAFNNIRNWMGNLRCLSIIEYNFVCYGSDFRKDIRKKLSLLCKPMQDGTMNESVAFALDEDLVNSLKRVDDSSPHKFSDAYYVLDEKLRKYFVS